MDRPYFDIPEPPGDFPVQRTDVVPTHHTVVLGTSAPPIGRIVRTPDAALAGLLKLIVAAILRPEGFNSRVDGPPLRKAFEKFMEGTPIR